MTFVFFLSLLFAFVLSMAACLQSDAAWWKGSLAAIALGVVTTLLFLFVAVEVPQGGNLPPSSGMVVAAFLGNVLIGAGSGLALMLRKMWSPGKIAKVVFLGGWMHSFMGMMTLAFS
ncbi:hypothetical protein [Shimia sp. SDUM112013]|uniref:hypothetical protein n=1 Tax=Shimia sp. SDUM112013 TaxID=3136160 RepID=UPI0032EB4CCD